MSQRNPTWRKDATLSVALQEKLLKSIAVSERGCWEWQMYVSLDGYGRSGWANSGSMNAHRLSYLAFLGDYDEELHIDHLCRNRRCINPEHLEAVTCAENVRRGEAGLHNKARLAGRSHCKNGHEFTPENTRMSGATRICRECGRLKNARYQERRRRAVA